MPEALSPITDADLDTVREGLGPAGEIDLERAFRRLHAIASHLAAIFEMRGIPRSEIKRPEVLETIAQIDRRLVDAYGEDYNPAISHSLIVGAFDRRFDSQLGSLVFRPKGGG